ncbi:SbcB [Desulforapulum autotrophicum HRM2]|uniref:SbcB n=1 Tax=Desulforapulum autotrophicum (strain ATCC 43914 / DSM 3382 / VKM B-1955 / HRM2) TaxID=177437 RepID=C0QKN8_DESAH|nr:exonuclease domain-containing protein [Desulforapulum autotrophicum]ACN16128.1 SbcB [Desulforapulum autotrophicum HRM2]
MKTFLFYDIETSGLNPAFDQILTFAAIRTDLELREIDRTSIVISLRNDIVPSPGAFITHRLTPEDLKDGLCEYQGVALIHRLLNTPDTISIGYNSLGFDDEFLRFAFYRNLLDPYTHQYANDCARMDLLPIATLYRIFKPDGIHWPVIDDKASMRLELISEKNNLVQSGRAHDAMTDVEATLALARRLSGQKRMWNYCLDFFDKKNDQARLDAVDEVFQSIFGRHRLCIMVSVSFGSDLTYMAPVLSLGHSTPYANQSLWLRLDKELVLPFKPDSGDGPFVLRKRYGEAKIVLPSLDRFWNRLTPSQHQVCEKNIAMLKANQDEFQKLVIHHRSFKYPFVPDLDLDASLYQDGFFSSVEKKEMGVFHRAINNGEMGVCETLVSPRVKGLAQRIVLRNFYEQAAPEVRAGHDRYMVKIRGPLGDDPVKGYRNDLKFTCDMAAQELASVRSAQGLDADQKAILDWLDAHIKSM